MRSLILGALCGGVVVLNAGCDGSIPLSQTQNCEVISHSSSNSYNLSYQLLLPAPCPVPITNVGERKDAAGKIVDGGLPDFEFAELVITNSQGVSKNGVVATFVDQNGTRSATPRLSYEAGTGAYTITDRVPTNAYDYGRFMAFLRGQYNNSNNPYGTVEISYEKSAVNVTLSGPEIPPLNTTQTWTAAPHDGISPYQYRWYRDGTAVGTGSSYTGSTGTTPFGLRVEVNDANTALAATVMAVDVGGVRTSISGPSAVYATQNGGTWYASGIGGQQPYSYEWFVDDNLVGTGSSWSGYPGHDPHTLHVRMQDAVGATHSAATSVVGIGTDDPGCQPVPPQLTCSS